MKFADDVGIFAENSTQLNMMLEDFQSEIKEAGLEVNLNKTKILANDPKHPIQLNGKSIDYTEDVTYLGQILSFVNKDSKELNSRIAKGWKS